ncbi:ATP-binding protein [Plantactinospora sp. ZYX-F-223]|uniref:ATP-binding protein n=1 Tax=Plantactinospora sp. ZYX-F-223 TaxID=3144103 RepID=UPI0031FBC9F8
MSGGIPLLDDEGRPVHRLVAIQSSPDVSGQDRELAGARATLLPALGQAHAFGSTVLHAWVRPAPGAPIEVLTGGFAAVGATGPYRSTLYPLGGLVVPLADGAAGRTLRSLPAWVRCAGGVDTLAAPATGQRSLPGPFVFEDCVTQLVDTPFAWFVVAEPVADEHARGRLRELAYAIPRLRDRQGVSETGRMELEQAEARYRELARAEPAGLWDVHVLVGAADSVRARGVAALLCRAAATAPLPYALRPLPEVADGLDGAWAAPGRVTALHAPFAAPAEVVAAVARPPHRELPGVRIVRPNTFDVTPETVPSESVVAPGTVSSESVPPGTGTAAGSLVLGTVLDRALLPAGEFRVGAGTLNRHTFVCGATGAGKSQTVRALLESLHGAGVPWLVIEPAKAEYAGMAGRLPPDAGVLVIRPGEVDVAPASLNPLEPEPGFPMQTHIDLVRALFLAAFEANEPFPQVLSQAIVRCYEELGWELPLSEPRDQAVRPRYPTLGDLQRAAREVVTQIGYSDRIAADVRGFVDVRLGSLRLGTPGQFFEGGHPLDLADLLRRNVVLELEDIGDDQDKAFFIGTVLIRIVEHLRVRAARDGAPRGLRHVTVIEEAHRLLKRVPEGSPAAHAVELFAGLLAEIRAYGEGIVVAEQIPAKILPDVVKNTALKVVHRLPAADDRLAVGATMNLDPEQSQYVVTLPPGRAAVFADGMDRPVLVGIPLGEEREDAAAATRRAAIARPAFGGCPVSCRAEPCTVRRMVTAAGLVRDEPRLVLWAEVLTAAHVVGEAEPVPDARWLASVRGRADQATLTCATAQLAHEAVQVRYQVLASAYQPETLAGHLADRLRGWLLGPAAEDARCAGETHWQAGAFRWVDVGWALRRAGQQDGPHADTGQWRRRGLDLPGDTPAEQLAQLHARPESRLPGWTGVGGTSRPARWAVAVDRLSDEPDPRRRLRQAAGFLALQRPWLVGRFLPPAPGTAGQLAGRAGTSRAETGSAPADTPAAGDE